MHAVLSALALLTHASVAEVSSAKAYIPSATSQCSVTINGGNGTSQGFAVMFYAYTNAGSQPTSITAVSSTGTTSLSFITSAGPTNDLVGIFKQTTTYYPGTGVSTLTSVGGSGLIDCLAVSYSGVTGIPNAVSVSHNVTASTTDAVTITALQNANSWCIIGWARPIAGDTLTAGANTTFRLTSTGAGTTYADVAGDNNGAGVFGTSCTLNASSPTSGFWYAVGTELTGDAPVLPPLRSLMGYGASLSWDPPRETPLSRLMHMDIALPRDPLQ